MGQAARKQGGSSPEPVVVMLSLDEIRPNKLNPRTPNETDPDIVELADSIRGVGLLQPIVVTPGGVVIAGHRRLAACSMAGLNQVPAVIQIALPGSSRGTAECRQRGRASNDDEEDEMTATTTRPSMRTTPVLFSRQRQLLQLLDALGGTSGMLDFQKRLFLYCQEASTGEAPYDFVPYKFGAFSFTSYADRRKLIERGLLEDEDGWQITAEGRKIIGRTMDMHLAAFAERYRGLHGDTLVADTYRRFPFFATRSEIAERVLKGDDAALARIKAVRARATGPTLSTIGYEGHTLESYLVTLLKNGVTLLCDVRRNPISRKYGFSKRLLSQSSENVGIRYEHLPELGVASEQRQSLDTQADYDALFADYKRTCLPEQGAALEKIEGWIGKGERVTLTCYEHLPNQCHRHCVAEALEGRAAKTLAARHL